MALERLLIETDAPYLAPVPYRGTRNEPAYVVEVARRIAGLRATDFDAIAEATTSNARRVFWRERPPAAAPHSIESPTS